MKKFILFLFIASLFLTCNKKTDEILSTTVSIILLDQQGQNLLSTTSNLKENDIEVFVVRNGETAPFKPTNGNPRGFSIRKTIDNKEFLNFDGFDYLARKAEYTTTLIKLGSYGTDTIKCQIVSSGNHTRVTKVWYNGILKFDDSVNKIAPLFTVIK